jgi:hypothetical protein
MTDDQIAALRAAAETRVSQRPPPPWRDIFPSRVLSLLDRLEQAERERDALRADAARYRYLRQSATEELLRPATLHSEWPDLRTHWRFPVLIAYGPIGGPTRSLNECIDAAIAEPGDA